MKKNIIKKASAFIMVTAMLMTSAVSVFAGISTLNATLVGSGNAEGYVSGGTQVSGNATTGYYADTVTKFVAQSSGTGVIVGVRMVVKNGSTTVYDSKNKTTPAIAWKTATVEAHSGFFSSRNIVATTTHTLEGTVSFSKTTTTQYF